jgi:integrase/recombinase XerD
MPYQHKREPLTQEGAVRLADACKTPFEKLIIWTLLDTGLRISELAGLSKDHIDWQTHRLRVPSENGKVRIVPISSRIAPLLQSYFGLYGALDYSERHLNRIIKVVAGRAQVGSPVSASILRLTFAATALQKGVSLPALQYLLGHGSPSATQIFVNLSPDEAIDEFKRKW